MTPSDTARYANMRRIKAADTAYHAERKRRRDARKRGLTGPLTRAELGNYTRTPLRELRSRKVR